MSWYNPIDDVESVWTGITDTASATENIAQHVMAGAEWAADPHNWLRVLYVIGGAIAILMGVKVMFGIPTPSPALLAEAA